MRRLWLVALIGFWPVACATPMVHLDGTVEWGEGGDNHCAEYDGGDIPIGVATVDDCDGGLRNPTIRAHDGGPCDGGDIPPGANGCDDIPRDH